MKKIVLSVVAIICCIMLGGCIPNTPLTDAEMDAVAEYAAELLLRHDEKFNSVLLVSKDAWDQPEPTPGVATGTEPTPTPSGAIAIPEVSEEIHRQLTQVLGVKGEFSVTCDYYELLEEVSHNEYFSLSAKEGRQYVVLHFTITNLTDEEKVFDASEQKLECAVDVNLGTISKASLSMLENDLRYMPITVAANSSADAVLVFEISSKTEISSVNFSMMNKENASVFIKLK